MPGGASLKRVASPRSARPALQWLAGGAVAACCLLAPRPAEALLLFTVQQDGADVVVRGKSIGAVNVGTLGTSVGNVDNLIQIDGVLGQLGTGRGKAFPADTTPANIVNLIGYSVMGPDSFAAPDGGFAFGNSSDSAAQSIYLDAFNGVLYLPSAYAGDYAIDSTTVFSGVTLQDLGLSRGTYDWTWGSSQLSETFRLEIDPVPAPLPLLGAGAAFCWSRRLRRRLQVGQSGAAS